MTEYIAALAVSLAFIVLGIFNLCGNISLLHSYHRNRVSEENRKPMGRLIGIGIIIIAISLIIGSTGTFISELTEKPIYNTVGMVALAIGLICGLVLNFYAIKKYNGKIFG